MQPKVEGSRGIWSTFKEKAHETKEKAKGKISYGILRVADAIDGSPEGLQETNKVRGEIASKRGRTTAYGRNVSATPPLQSTSSSSIPSTFPASMPTSHSGSSLSSIQTVQHLPASSTSCGTGITRSNSSTPPPMHSPSSSLHPYPRGASHTSSSSSSTPTRQWSPAPLPPTPSSRHSPTVTTSTSTISITDPRTLIATAEQKLKDACKLQNAALAMEAKPLLARAADLLKDTDRKASIRYQFASQRCDDISDLMSHNIRVSDYKKICYNDIDAHLDLCTPRTCSRLDGFEYFVASNPLVPKMSGTVLPLLQENQFKEALHHIRETGQHYREQCIDFMYIHCERQLAFLSIAMANQGISNVHANKSKTELCQAVKKIGSLDSSTAVKILNEAIRCETACQIISKGHRIADIETFLNGNTPPATRDQMIQTFYGLSGQSSAPSTSSDTRARPPQKPVPPTPGPHSYAPRSLTPSGAVRGTTSSSSSDDSRIFVKQSTGEILVSPTTSDHAISALQGRRALFTGYGGQLPPFASPTTDRTTSSSSTSSSAVPQMYQVWESNSAEVAKLAREYRSAVDNPENERNGRLVIAKYGEAAKVRQDIFMEAHCSIMMGSHFLGLACDNMAPDFAKTGSQCFIDASRLIASTDMAMSKKCANMSEACTLAEQLIRKGVCISNLSHFMANPMTYRKYL